MNATFPRAGGALVKSTEMVIFSAAFTRTQLLRDTPAFSDSGLDGRGVR